MRYKNIVIGAGAAGLFFCSCLNEKKNSQTLLIEGNDINGKKLLISGSGRCNVTNKISIKEFVNKYGSRGKKIRKILYSFNNEDVISFFNEKNTPMYCREDGKVFPKSMRSRDIVNILENLSLSNGVEIKNNCRVDFIAPENEFNRFEAEKSEIRFEKDKINIRYKVVCESGDTFLCENLIIATGGRSYSKTGSDGKLILKMANELSDIALVKMRPALVPIYVENYKFGDISGVSIKNVDMKIRKGDKIVHKNLRDDILFTHRNLSGPLVINNSRYLENGDKIELNFLNDFIFKNMTSKEEMSDFIKAIAKDKRSVLNALSEELSLPKSFMRAALNDYEEELRRNIADIGERKLRDIIFELMHYEMTVSGNEGFDKAMATAGGVDLDDIDIKNMEHKKHPGLHFLGECLDVDGDTGGYNIQFAFSTAYIAARHILRLP